MSVFSQKDHGGRRNSVQRFGLILAVVFFVVSAIAAFRNHGGMEVITGDAQIITIAHWQLEDGFREGFAEAIKIYEKKKAEQGIKVKVRQVAIPVRGYQQWMLTQLIGGEPADILEMIGSSDIHNRYFVPLSPYIDASNPWNKGSVLEKFSWRESFADDMLSAMDGNYSEYFGVCIFMHTTRLYVNMDLYRKACGDVPLPATVSEWVASCRKLQEYGRQVNRPIVPIGVRGFDKGTIGQLLGHYNSQLNADLAGSCSPDNYTMLPAYAFKNVNSGKLDRKRLLEPVRVVHELGRYFADGFPSIDLEQTKYLFASGNVAYFIDGTWNAWSMVNNSPFEVKVARLPVLDSAFVNGAATYGEITELGSGISGKFGITRKSRNFDLALDFLRYITSYDVNRKIMVEHCKWMSSLKNVKYHGLMKSFEPVSRTGYIPVSIPFNTGVYGSGKVAQWLEKGIIDRVSDPQEHFWRNFAGARTILCDELQESVYGVQRTMWTIEGTMSSLRIGLTLQELSGDERRNLLLRSNVSSEGLVERYRTLDAQKLFIDELNKITAEE